MLTTLIDTREGNPEWMAGTVRWTDCRVVSGVMGQLKASWKAHWIAIDGLVRRPESCDASIEFGARCPFNEQITILPALIVGDRSAGSPNWWGWNFIRGRCGTDRLAWFTNATVGIFNDNHGPVRGTIDQWLPIV